MNGLRAKISVILHNRTADFSNCAVNACFQKSYSLVLFLCNLTVLSSGAIGNLGNDVGYVGGELNAHRPLYLSVQPRGFRGINRAIALFIPRSP